MDVGDWISLGSASIAFISMMVTVFVTRAQLRRADVNQSIQYTTLKKRYFEFIHSWADQVSDVFSECIHFCEFNSESGDPARYEDRRNEIRTRMSSLLDRGRWFFPNVDTDSYGLHKEEGFRGYRHEVLDSLYEAYVAFSNVDIQDSSERIACRIEIVRAKKCFVTQIQAVLDPVRDAEEFKKITKTVNPATKEIAR